MNPENQILALEKISCKLEISKNTFQQDINQITTELSFFLDDLENKPGLIKNTNPSMVNSESVICNSIKNQINSGIETASGNFMGFIPGGGILTCAYADLITAVTNKYAGLSFAAPGAAEVENKVIQSFIDMFEFNDLAWGALASGGTSAFINCILAALNSRENFQERHLLRCYISDQSHHSLKRIMKMVGIRSENIVIVPTFEGKLNIKKLEEIINKDQENPKVIPFLVVSTFGTTNSGQIDPIERIVKIAEKNSLWHHLDAAYGGFFYACDPKKYNYLNKVDSIVFDPHKGLFMSYGVGAAIVKDGALLRKAFSENPEYLEDAIDLNKSPADYSFELTRHNRALRIKLSFDYFGEDIFKASLKEKLLLAKYLYARLSANPNLIIFREPELSIVLFRLSTNEKTYNLLGQINDNSDIFLSSTKIGDNAWIRVCILSFRTHLKHIKILVSFLEDNLNE